MKSNSVIASCLLVTLFFFSSLSFAQSNQAAYKPAIFTDQDRLKNVQATAETVDLIFKEYAKEHHTPGFVYGIVLDGELVYSGGFGYKNVEKQTPVNNASLFRIASMSKSFTAIAILQLRDAGKLNLDDPASKYIPEMKNLVYPTMDSPKITIRHLLTHGAGFPEDNPWGDRQLADTDKEFLQMVKDGLSFSNAPGIAYEYSNLGFALLGQIIQKVTGMPFEKYTTEHILKPLGMNATVWEFEKAQTENLALGYNWIDSSYVNIPLEHHGAFGAMGGLITSINDFVKYVNLHLSAWPPKSDTDTGILKRSSLREMHYPWRFFELSDDFYYLTGEKRKCPYVKAYGYGLRWMQDCNGKVYISHTGGLPGFGSNWCMMPDYGLAVMSFDNRTYGGTSSVNVAVLDTVITLANLEPRQLPVSNILEQRLNQMIKILPDWQNAESSGLFADNFFLDFRVKDLVKNSKQVYDKAGDIIDIGPLKAINQLRGTIILHGKDKDIEIFLTLSPEKNPLIQHVEVKSIEKTKYLN